MVGSWTRPGCSDFAIEKLNSKKAILVKILNFQCSSSFLFLGYVS